jgi:hypothetical protein
MQCDNPACQWWSDGVPSATVFDQSYVWPPEPLAPRKAFQELAWRLVGPSNRVLCCEIVGVPTGLEVHARYDLEADPVRTQLARGLADARTIAAQWREAALGTGGFLELDLMK